MPFCTRLRVDRRLNLQLLICTVLLVTTALAADTLTAAPPAAPGPSVALSTTEIVTGGVLIVTVDARALKTPAAEPALGFGEQSIPLFPHPARPRGVYAGLVGIPVTASPGPAAVTVTWTEGPHRRTLSAGFRIRPGVYGEDTLAVDPRHVRPSPQDQERIRREQVELKQVYASGSRSRLWRGSFEVPVPGEMHGPFGTRRVFNDELQSQHNGADFRAQTGDPIRAAGAGVVRLAKDLFYSGHAVILDHGAGVFTSYSHLSRIDVKVGQNVDRGAVIGLAGATGRVTGPHLHWTVKIGAANVDPLEFLEVMRRMETP
jgi:murein DD-endopeptidase MepM/ murein hydrolase activator NlpD